jgi:hypothetical protein
LTKGTSSPRWQGDQRPRANEGNRRGRKWRRAGADRPGPHCAAEAAAGLILPLRSRAQTRPWRIRTTCRRRRYANRSTSGHASGASSPWFRDDGVMLCSCRRCRRDGGPTIRCPAVLWHRTLRTTRLGERLTRAAGGVENQEPFWRSSRHPGGAMLAPHASPCVCISPGQPLWPP